MASYAIWYCDEAGNHIQQVRHITNIEYTKVIGDVGFAQVVLPYSYASPRPVYYQARRDRRLHIYRNQVLDFVGFVVRTEDILNSEGESAIILTAASPEILLRRRIVANYTRLEPGGVGYRSTNADNIMKDIVSFALIQNQDYSGTPTPSRSISDYLQVATSTGDGPTVDNSHSWQNVLTVLKDLQAASKALGTEVFFYIPPAPGILTFTTRTGEPGRDVSDTVTFGQFNGTLASASLAYDFTDEVNKIYALGDGDLDEQLVATAVDTNRVNLSAVGLAEAAISSPSGLDADELSDVAQDELSRRRPSAIMTAEIVNNTAPVRNRFVPNQYGKNWNYGDRVKIFFRGKLFSVIIRAVNVRFAADGSETITARVEDLDYAA